MRIITGDECGLLKETIPEASRGSRSGGSDDGVSRLGDGRQARCRGVAGVAFVGLPAGGGDDGVDDDDGGDGSADAFAFAALRVDGSVETWEGQRRPPTEFGGARTVPGRYRTLRRTGGSVFADPPSGRASASAKVGAAAAGRPVGICTAHRTQPASTGGAAANLAANLAACVDSTGRLSLLDLARPDGAEVVAVYDAFRGAVAGGKTGGDPGPANCDAATALAMDGAGTRVAVGGRDRETAVTAVTDVASGGKVVWKAKNLPPDPQTLLQRPVWSTAMQFLSDIDINGGIAGGGPSDLLAVGTAYRQLRIYDVRVSDAGQQRRPVLCTDDGFGGGGDGPIAHRVTSLCQLDGRTVAVGTAAGDVQAFDLRRLAGAASARGRKAGPATAGAAVGRFVGPGGSVRQLVRHPTLPVLACVGLDRTLRTYDVSTRKMVDCVYLRQRLNCMLFCDDGTWSADGADGADFGGGGGEPIALGAGAGGDIDEADEVEDYVDSDEEMVPAPAASDGGPDW